MSLCFWNAPSLFSPAAGLCAAAFLQPTPLHPPCPREQQRPCAFRDGWSRLVSSLIRVRVPARLPSAFAGTQPALLVPSGMGWGPISADSSREDHQGHKGHRATRSVLGNQSLLSVQKAFSQYRDTRYNDKTIMRPFYLYDGNPIPVRLLLFIIMALSNCTMKHINKAEIFSS